MSLAPEEPFHLSMTSDPHIKKSRLIKKFSQIFPRSATPTAVPAVAKFARPYGIDNWSQEKRDSYNKTMASTAKDVQAQAKMAKC